MKCRYCHAELTETFLDLGTSPPSNSYLTSARLQEPESYYPLRVLVCSDCRLVQTEDFADRCALFDDDYAYFSSFSTQWLLHSQAYVAAMIARLGLDSSSLVAEVAANDGYLLQYVRDAGVPCYGIEPTKSTADAARAKGIEIVEEFFGVETALRLADAGRQVDLLAANNVLAHVPDINDFVSGFARLLKTDGVATFEFPHLMKLVEFAQFDTVYHEHFSYLSLIAIDRIFASNGLSVFDVEEIATHGGSLRAFAQRTDKGKHETTSSVASMLKRERDVGMDTPEFYTGFQARADRIKDDFVAFLIDARRQGKAVAAYGAAAKGNTLLNYGGVKADLLPWIVDRNPAKQNKFSPGSRIPIVDEQRLRTEKPDYVVILPWNLTDEVMTQLAYIREWDGQFVTAVPSLVVR
jgi:SAM-dependent methyltransferase